MRDNISDNLLKVRGFMKKSIIPICLIAALQGCSEVEVVEREIGPRPVKYLSVLIGDQDNYRTFPGVVESGDKAVLAFRVSGKLANIYARPGEKVAKGQKLARLEQDQFILQLEQAKANYELASVQFKRDAKLFKTNVISELDYDTSKSKLNQAKAALEKQQSNLSYSTLSAPYSGTLSLLLNENHEYVMAKQAVMNIQSAGVLNMAFELPEQMISSIQNGEGVTTSVVFDTFPDDVYIAKFKEIDTEANQSTSSYKVTLYLDRPEGRNILPGMSGTVRVKLPENQVMAIPENAIIRDAENTYVWVIDSKHRVHKTAVTLDSGNRILSGLTTGDQIAVSGVNSLTEGQMVRAWVKERGL